jgi:hypothetical protein
MRDLPASLDLLALARELLLGELAPLLPPERVRDAHLIATVMTIVSREVTEEEWQDGLLWQLSKFYAEMAPHPDPLPACGERESAGAIPSPHLRGQDAEHCEAGEGLLARFAADLRNGAFETSPSHEAAARAILWRLTIEKLRGSNPNFLVANGFRKASRQST